LRKVAILGAGPAGLGVAWELSRYPASFEVDVYQTGGVPGGKCGSGRGTHGRVEQNGTHYVFGCYSNFFRTMQEVYDSPGIAAQFGTMSENFLPRNYFVMQQRWQGGWAPWHICFGSNAMVPGHEAGKEPPLYLGHPATELVGILARMSLNLIQQPEWVDWANPDPPLSGGMPGEGQAPSGKQLDSLARTAAALLISLTNPVAPLLDHGLALELRLIRRAAWALADVNPTGLRTRRLALALDFGITHIVGLVRDGLTHRDDPTRNAAWPGLDDIDWRAWLKKHGARDDTADSCLTKLFYDAIAAYEGGLEATPRFAASAAVRALLSAAGNYRGAFAYQMRREIGDSVIAPWVVALEQRGVRFHYFHRVRNLKLSGAQTWVDAVEIEEQVQVTTANGRYDPFVTVKGKPSFRGTPDWSQLNENGQDGSDLHNFYTKHVRSTAKTLQRGSDYDDLVWALPIQVAPFVAQELIAHSPLWADAVAADPGVATQSLRLYLRDARKDFWGDHPAPVLGAYVHDFATWEDNEEMIASEDWGVDPPKAIATVFGPMPTAAIAAPASDVGFLQQKTLDARQAALAFCQADAAALWPGLDDGNGGLQWTALHDPTNQQGSGRLAFQHCVANVGPYERYSQVLPGSLSKRLTPGGAGFAGLWLAGDWTRTGVEIACIEGAVLSAVLCANHIFGTVPGLAPTDPYYWIIPV